MCFNWYRPKPLALYIFTCNKNDRTLLIENIPCGGISCNDTFMHAGGKRTESKQIVLCSMKEGLLIFAVRSTAAGFKRGVS
jgi:hypothetical protein